VKSAYKPLWGLLAIVVGLSAVIMASRAMRADERIPWRTDFAAASAEAKQSGKPLFAYFTASWCGPCQSLKHTTWADADVAAALGQYVPVKIDIDEHPDLAEQYRIQAVPTFVVVAADGQGPTHETSGALGPADFLRWLDLRAR
jgi:thioredoxin-like negative regulator of GroEL